MNRRVLEATLLIFNPPVVSKDPLLTNGTPFVSLNKYEKYQICYLVSYAFYLYVEHICTFFHWSSIKIPLKLNTSGMKTSEKGKYRKCAAFYH